MIWIIYQPRRKRKHSGDSDDEGSGSESDSDSDSDSNSYCSDKSPKNKDLEDKDDDEEEGEGWEFNWFCPSLLLIIAISLRVMAYPFYKACLWCSVMYTWNDCIIDLVISYTVV